MISRPSTPVLRQIRMVPAVLTAAVAFAQTPGIGVDNAPKGEGGQVAAAGSIQVPTRTLEFKAIDSDPALSLSPITTLPPHCTSDGSLFLDLLDPKDLARHTVVSVRGRRTQTYSPSAISDLHSIHVFSFFPSDSMVGFLVRGTKSSPSASAAVPWSEYHNYIALFDRDGSYKKSIELPMAYPPSHIAILPSGEFLVSGYDKVNSAARLLFLDSSGQIVRLIDLPASRTSPPVSPPYGSGESMMQWSKLIGFVVFTAYKDDILVWRARSSDPILDVGPGGRVREVTLQVPPGLVFEDMLASTDRWVAHFRSSAAKENSALNQSDYFYYEVRPEDGTLSSKLLQTGVIPLSLACEGGGNYEAFTRDKDKKLILLGSE